MRNTTATIQRRFQDLVARYRGSFSQRPVRSALLTAGAFLLILLLVWLILVSYSGLMVRAKVNSLSNIADNPGELDVSQEQVDEIHQDVQSLDTNIRRLNFLTRIPLLEPAIAEIPWVGPRYESVRTLLKMGTALGQAGATGVDIGRDAYAAFDESGISYEADESADTWLMAVERHRDEIPGIAQQIENASELRSELQPAYLPGMVRRRMDTLDKFLNRADELVQLANDYEDFHYAAGGEGTIRYLFLFQNPAELRPAGGFPGTFGVFEFNSGQLVGYEMWDSHDVTSDYIENRTEKLEQPWPFETYAPQDGFLLHDATWYSDFPYTAQILLDMYQETTWPEVNGVVAVQPDAVSDMVSVTGPVEVDIDGEMREVNEDNVYEEVERYRWLRFQGEREGVLGDHKNILIDIGEAIMDEFQRSGGSDMVDAARQMMDSAERRNLQIYVEQTGVQRFLERRGWSGSLDPDPDTPTIAITFTNFVLEKASMAMDPKYDLYLKHRGDDRYEARMEMTLNHSGRHDQDPRYFGFQRWWIEVKLPDEAEWLDASNERMPDPEAHNGGSYAIDLFPEQTKEVWVDFTLPRTDELMLRRQPGQVPPNVDVHLEGCDPVDGGYLVRDLYMEFEDDCPHFPEIEEEPPDLLELS